MIWVALFLIIFAGLFLLLNGTGKTVKGLKNRLTKENVDKALEESLFRDADLSRKKDRIKYIKNQKPSHIEIARAKVKDVILHKDTGWGYFSYVIATLICAGAGYYIGAMIMNNIFAGIVLGITFAVFPYWYSQIKITRIGKDKDEKLLIVMSNIQSAYMKHNSFVNAVKEVLPNIPEPLKKYFKLFVDEASIYATDGSIIPSMEKLAFSVDNYFFTEYMQLAVLAEKGDVSLKATMQSVPRDYQNYLQKNHEFASIVEDYNFQFFTRILSLPLMIGFLRVVSKDFYDILTNHPLGKLSFVLLLVVYVVAAVIYKKYNKEIRLEL